MLGGVVDRATESSINKKNREQRRKVIIIAKLPTGREDLDKQRLFSTTMFEPDEIPFRTDVVFSV